MAFGPLPRADVCRCEVTKARLRDSRSADRGHEQVGSEGFENENSAACLIGQRPMAAWLRVFASPMAKADWVQVVIKIHNTGKDSSTHSAEDLGDAVEHSLHRWQCTYDGQPRRHGRVQVSARGLRGHDDANCKNQTILGSNLFSAAKDLEQEGPNKFSEERDGKLTLAHLGCAETSCGL